MRHAIVTRIMIFVALPIAVGWLLLSLLEIILLEPLAEMIYLPQ